MMKLNKRQSFLAILAGLLFLCLLYQAVWIFSRTTTAAVYAADATNYRGRGRSRGISLMYATYTVGNTTFHGSYFRNEHDVENRSVEIRYLIFAPDISRTNTFSGNWGALILLFIALGLITSIVFIRKDIVSDQAIIILQARRPFVKIEHNQIEDYDTHDLEDNDQSEAKLLFRKRVETETDLFKSSDIPASVYKLNPNAVGIFIGYGLLLIWSFDLLLHGHLGYPSVLSLVAFFVFVPLFVQNTKNPVFKAKIPDQGSLVFSSLGVQFKDDFYPIEDIEAAVVYLEAFDGFKYREQTTIGKANTTSSGDNNKISFRYKGQVVDFTFILGFFSDYWSFKNLMGGWSGRGVNVLLQKVFEDDFVLQEMVEFSTPVSAPDIES
jgi:hypothetical protein